MNPYETYVMFNALKLHFKSTEYDYHKFNGKIKAVLKPNDKDFWIYKKLSDYDPPVIFELCLSNILSNPKIYIRNLLTDKAKEEYNFWKQLVSNKEEIFLLQLKYIIKHQYSNLISQLESKNKYDVICKLYYQTLLSKESCVILNNYYDFQNDPEFKDCLEYNIMFNKLWFIIEKYKPFLSLPPKENILKIFNYLKK